MVSPIRELINIANRSAMARARPPDHEPIITEEANQEAPLHTTPALFRVVSAHLVDDLGGRLVS